MAIVMTAAIIESDAYNTIRRRLRIEKLKKAMNDAYAAADKEMSDTCAVAIHTAGYKETINAAIVKYRTECSRAVKSFLDALQCGADYIPYSGIGPL
jgi:hypothetical protein